MDSVELKRRYDLIRELGSGGRGQVYLVHDRYLGRRLALKVLRGLVGDDDVESFRREFATLSRLEHPGIARVFDFGVDGGRPYFTAEFIDGAPLAAEGAAVEDPLGLARSVCEALAYLHRSELLHLDVKPSNILYSRRLRRAVLIDFGLHRVVGTSSPDGALHGSLPYLAPEALAAADLGPATDVYAFGVTIYEALTGTLPRQPILGEGDRGVSAFRSLPPPVPPSRLCPSIPPDLENVILACMAIDPHSRFSDATEVERALEKQCVGRTAAPRSRAFVSLIGRTGELDCAESYVERLSARTRPPGSLIVSGEPGAGQSRLLAEIKLIAQTAGIESYLVPKQASGEWLPRGGGRRRAKRTAARHAAWARSS